MLRRLVSVACTAVLVAALAAVAPPGAAQTVSGRIAFQSDRDGNEEIYVTSSAGLTETNLTNSPVADEFDPAWSRNGAWIAFARHTSPLGGTHIMVMRPGGCCARAITNVPGVIDRQPTWSP